MAKKNTAHDIDFSWNNIKFKQRFRIDIATKSSHFFWFFMDNISCKLEGLAKIYERSIKNEYKKEYLIIDLTKVNNVLHIGCGAYPLTDITLAQLPGIHVVGVDNDPKAVKLAQAVVDKKNLNKQIMIKHADGRNYPVTKFNIIIVSSCSRPKKEILQHVFKNAKKQCKIIVRELDHAVEPLTRCINSHKNIVLIKRLHHNPFPFIAPFGWQTFYLQRK